MMSAKKLSGKGSSYYLISLDMNPEDDRGSEAVLGRLRGNAVGSEYMITDAGVTAGKTRLSSIIRKELAYIHFDYDSTGPSRTTVWVPEVTPLGASRAWQPEVDTDGIEACVKAKKSEGLMELQNKRPRWDAKHGGHVLNFNGRVTESSVKNFQMSCLSLPSEQERDSVVLQFGKKEGRDMFSLDVDWPLSPLQAFGLCVASIDRKIADRKGYEFARKAYGFVFGGGPSHNAESK